MDDAFEGCVRNVRVNVREVKSAFFNSHGRETRNTPISLNNPNRIQTTMVDPMSAKKKMERKKSCDLISLEKELGPGPMRFAPIQERTIEEQIRALSPSERKCFDALKSKWEKKMSNQPPFTDEMYLRFARCSPGTQKFNDKASWKVMKKFDQRYIHLTAEGLEKQLLSKVRSDLT